MDCNIEQRSTFTIAVDMTGLACLERALSFYAERAILPDGDPARDLSRQFTSMLLRLGRVNPDKVPAPPESPLLPPATAEVPAVTDAEEAPPAPEEGAPVPSEEVPPTPQNPLEVELESMMGDRPEEDS